MKKLLLLGAGILALTQSISAGPISPEQALQRVTSSRNKAMSSVGSTPKLIYTESTDDGVASVYIFNRSNNDGFMLLSADDRAYPMLGYTDEGSFDPNNIPPALQYMLGEYSRQIEYANSHPDVALKSKGVAEARLNASRAGRQSIEPMIQTQWDQVAPYNNLCPDRPIYSGGNIAGSAPAYTGCVATSMAQVMKYWNYPDKYNQIPAYKVYDSNGDIDQEYTRLRSASLNWDDMLLDYTGNYTEAQAEAVAVLMRACGYSVKMDYGTDSSGALAMAVRDAMVNYFKYDGNAQYTLRMYYATSDWEELMYNNLKNVGPIICGGGSLVGGGHSFICDGYDEATGFFHFNWGWTGMSNGYYSLDALNPDALGSGGGYGGGYNFTQDAVIGIQPPTGEPVESRPAQMTQCGSLIANVTSDNILQFNLDMEAEGMWVNYTNKTLYPLFGARFELQGSDKEPVYVNIRTYSNGIKAGYGAAPYATDGKGNITARLFDINLNNANLEDGTYKVSIATKNSKSLLADWLDVIIPHSYYGYIILKKQGNTYTVENMEAPSLIVKSWEFTTPIYYSSLVGLKVEIENPSDVELTTGLAPYLVSKNPMADGARLGLLGESVFVTVKPHSTVTREWSTMFYNLNSTASVTEPTEFMMAFMDEASYGIFDTEETVIVKPTPEPKIFLASTPRVENAHYESANISGIDIDIYAVWDPQEIRVSYDLRLESEFFGYPILACLCERSEENQNAVSMDTPGKVTTASCSISYPQMRAEKTYMLVMAYDNGAGAVILPYTEKDNVKNVFLILDTSGVDDVVADGGSMAIDYDRDGGVVSAKSAGEIVSLSVYTVSGSLIGTVNGNGDSEVSLSVNDAPRGVIIARATDARGNVKTLKIVR